MIRSDLKALLHTPPQILRHAADAGAVLGTLACLELNLNGYPFPGWSTADSRRAVADKLLAELHSMPQRKWAFCAELAELSLQERYILMERGQLTSPMAARQDGVYLLLNDTQDTECFINDEEHLRLQSFYPGEDSLAAAEADMRRLRKHLQERLDVAQDEVFGYLSYDPTKTGAGLFFSLLVYLPGMRLGKHMPQVQRALEEMGVYITPFFAYRKKAVGDLWLLHAPPAAANQLESTLKDMGIIARDIETQELQAREKLLSRPAGPARLQESVRTACRDLSQHAGLRFGRMLESLSLLRLGLHYGWLQADAAAEHLAEAYLKTAPMHLQYAEGASSEKARYTQRSAYIQDMLQHKLKLTYNI